MTPDAVKYQMASKNEQQLRMRMWQPGVDGANYDDAPVRPARCSDFAATPTNRPVV